MVAKSNTNNLVLCCLQYLQKPNDLKAIRCCEFAMQFVIPGPWNATVVVLFINDGVDVVLGGKMNETLQFIRIHEKMYLI